MIDIMMIHFDSMQPRTFFCLNGKMLCKQVASLEIAFFLKNYFAAFMIIWMESMKT